MTASTKKIVSPAEYEVKSKEIDRLWNLFSKTGQDLDKVILEARIILENSGYSRTEAMKKIADDHKHLRGFSLANLYRMLPKEDKQYQASKIRIGDREQEKDSHFENDLELQTSDQKRYGLNNEVGQEEKEDTYKDVDVSNGTDESINATTTESDTKNAETNYDENERQQEGEQVSIQEYKLLRQQIEEQNKEIQKLSEAKKREESIKKQLPEEVVKIAENVELSINKLELLTLSRLRDHPELQKSLVYRIKDCSPQRAKMVVYQQISDLETKALRKTKDGNYIYDGDKREKIGSKFQREKSSIETYLDLVQNIQNLLQHMTGHKIAKGESKYEKRHIEKTELYRIQLAKNLTEPELISLESDLLVLNEAVQSFMHLIGREVLNIK